MTCLAKDADEQNLSNMKKTVEHLDNTKMQKKKTKAKLQFSKKNTLNAQEHTVFCFLCYAFLVHTVPSKIFTTACKD